MRKVLFYVSGHGYGHAARTAEIVRALIAAAPDCVPLVRCGTGGELIERLFAGVEQLPPIRLDPGVVEHRGALAIDAAASVARLSEFLKQADRIVVQEIDFLRRLRPSLIVADIPYLAGPIAYAVGVPCIAVGNFTWDWIYEPLVADRVEGPRWLAEIRAGYERMPLFLRLPFHHAAPMFPRLLDVPLVARHSTYPAEQVLAELNIRSSDARTRVLIAMRDPVPAAVLEAMARSGRDFLFLTPDPLPSGHAENLRSVPPGPRLQFPDLLAACPITVGKLGYSLLAECIACRSSLLFPPRSGFREEPLLRAAIGRFVRGNELPLADYTAGHWIDHLRALRNAPEPAEPMATDGAAVCARIIAEHCRSQVS